MIPPKAKGNSFLPCKAYVITHLLLSVIMKAFS